MYCLYINCYLCFFVVLNLPEIDWCVYAYMWWMKLTERVKYALLYDLNVCSLWFKSFCSIQHKRLVIIMQRCRILIDHHHILLICTHVLEFLINDRMRVCMGWLRYYNVIAVCVVISIIIISTSSCTRDLLLLLPDVTTGILRLPIIEYFSEIQFNSIWIIAIVCAFCDQ